MTETDLNTGGVEETTIFDSEDQFMDLMEFNIPISQPNGTVDICKLSEHRRLQKRRYRQFRKILRALCKQPSELETSNDMQISPYLHKMIFSDPISVNSSSNSDLLFHTPSPSSFTNVTNTSSVPLFSSPHISNHNCAFTPHTNYQVGITILFLLINALISFVRRFL
ncbi:hypothetical protein ACS0PU_012926 [Formica fusca]